MTRSRQSCAGDFRFVWRKRVRAQLVGNAEPTPIDIKYIRATLPMPTSQSHDGVERSS
jgi:hypothetical protein